MDSKHTIAILLAFVTMACTERDDASGKMQKDSLDPVYSNLKDFWSSPHIPGREARAIGFGESIGLYVFWEQLENMPMTSLHTAYGSYSENEMDISLSSPFCGNFQLRKDVIDGLDVLLPKDMSLNDARESGWLLIHREGASPSSPFSIRDMTILDK